MDIQDYLREHPLPWRLDSSRDDVYVAICDANGNRIDFALKPRLPEKVEIEHLKARLAEVIAERETAIDDAAELHALFGAHQELIERLQNRIRRLEARS